VRLRQLWQGAGNHGGNGKTGQMVQVSACAKFQENPTIILSAWGQEKPAGKAPRNGSLRVAGRVRSRAVYCPLRESPRRLRV